ncbi:Nucleotide/sugar transporter family protein isoform 1 [Theobroma cacao]|uniref:Nucleotide/sugar transporter family protein isoform 1 n=1 Tax=Theobroma cacao TaxID=3641 RepID=A0A061GRF6_THECC|nr:Nucleotide/sugar transporter family protein isoform 1 [Theobroma cacao]
MLCSREIFSFLVRKDVRKILKRKDSDAGERGKALEDLRASLFNKFHSSESAKRQQQRSCGPVAALTFNFMVAVGIIFMNKWVLKNVGFQFPVFLTFIHYAVSWALMAILNSFSLLPASPPSKSTPLSLFTLGIVMSLSTGLANVSLKYNSVGFYQMAKIAVTPSIVLAEFIWYKKKVTFSKVIALTVVSIGVAIATVTDLQFSLFGACVALAWIIPSAVNKILWSNMQQQENWTALSFKLLGRRWGLWDQGGLHLVVLMWKTTPITLLFLVSMIPFLDPPGVLAFHWSFNNTSAILMSAFLGFLLQWSGALALGATSAISHVVLGQFKTCVLFLGSYYLFGSNPGTTSICGAFVAIGGMSFFTYLNLHAKQQPSPLKVSSSLPKSKLSESNGENRDGFGAESV